MTQRRYKRLVELVIRCGPEVILTAADLCDGHSIFDPQAFLDAGLPANVVAHLTRTYKSDLSSPKSALFVKGTPVKELTGIYGLEMLRFLAGALGVEYTPALGRGTEARNIQCALHGHYKKARVSPPST